MNRRLALLVVLVWAYRQWRIVSAVDSFRDSARRFMPGVVK